MKIINFNFFLFLLLFINISSFSKVISIPFKLKKLQFSEYYNSNQFLYDYFKRELNLEINIGTPTQKINGILNQNYQCLTIEKDKLNNNYFPYKSSSFQEGLYNNFIFYKLKNGEDKFYFQEDKKGFKLSFTFDYNKNISNDSYSLVIGLSNPNGYYGRYYLNFCPNLLHDLKSKGKIKKTIWTIKYNNNEEGEFIIGDNLYEYEPNKYSKSQYLGGYYSQSHSLTFDSLYIQDKFDKTNYLISNNSNSKIREADIIINYGLIIGTSEYKNYIDKFFFNNLINKNICKIDKIKYIQDDTNKKFNNIEYFVYSCNKKEFKNNYFKNFPNLIFNSKKLEYNFELSNKDLFKVIQDRYYFLIVFKNENSSHPKELWNLGEPFYKKFTISGNLDSKIIGVYKAQIKNDEEEIDYENNINETTMKNYQKNIKRVLLYIIAIIIGIGLLFFAYFLGVRVRERRRKLANELKDDNYEYLPEKNKNINEDTNSTNKQQFIELNSKLGL